MNWVMIVYIIVIGALFYFMLIRPQKKKQKAEEKLRNSLQIGDEILTIGGFYGKVVSLKEDSIVIESVLDHSKQKIAKWAIQQNLTVHDDTPAK
ncbi:MAG: preprotein translocase subunit YajC [Clostridia bacterium]|nr:preprotein translocase subunit YajC [Clostridia bacterium]